MDLMLFTMHSPSSPESVEPVGIEVVHVAVEGLGTFFIDR